MCHDLDGHLDETIPAPTITILQRTTEEDEKLAEILVHNHEFVFWEKRDQTFVAYITATLFKNIFHTISNNLSANELCEFMDVKCFGLRSNLV